VQVTPSSQLVGVILQVQESASLTNVAVWHKLAALQSGHLTVVWAQVALITGVLTHFLEVVSQDTVKQFPNLVAQAEQSASLVHWWQVLLGTNVWTHPELMSQVSVVQASLSLQEMSCGAQTTCLFLS
jgi:hypothetical protein